MAITMTKKLIKIKKYFTRTKTTEDKIYNFIFCNIDVTNRVKKDFLLLYNNRTH